MSSVGDQGWSRVILPGALAGLLVIGLLPVWARTAHFCFNEYDLGIYTEGLARLSWHHPNPWLSARQIRLFSDHFDPVLWLAVPAARLLGASVAGLAVEALFVIASAGPLLWLVRRGMLSPTTGSLLAALLLLNPATLDALAFPFHPTTWAMLPWVALIASLRARQRGLCLTSLVLLFACKEEFPFVGLLLGVVLLVQGERPLAVAVLVLSVAWLAFVFAARPHLWGPVHPYAAHLFEGALTRPLAFLGERLASARLRKTLGLMLLPCVPLAIWLLRQRATKALWVPALLMMPPLAIRFLGDAWGHHYGAVLVAGVAGIGVFAIDRSPLPRWVVGSTLALLVVADIGPIDAAIRTLLAQDPRRCPGDPARLTALREGLRRVEQAPGPLAVEGHLLPALLEKTAGRTDAFMLFGPHGTATFRTVLAEKPPHGDAWPGRIDPLSRLIEHWRTRPGALLLQDDAYVFLAELPPEVFPSP